MMRPLIDQKGNLSLFHDWEAAGSLGHARCMSGVAETHTWKGRLQQAHLLLGTVDGGRYSELHTAQHRGVVPCSLQQASSFCRIPKGHKAVCRAWDDISVLEEAVRLYCLHHVCIARPRRQLTNVQCSLLWQLAPAQGD